MQSHAPAISHCIYKQLAHHSLFRLQNKKNPLHLFMKENMLISMLYGEEIPVRVIPGYLCKAKKKPKQTTK